MLQHPVLVDTGFVCEARSSPTMAFLLQLQTDRPVSVLSHAARGVMILVESIFVPIL